MERWRQQAQAQHVKKRETVQVSSWGRYDMKLAVLLGSLVPILYMTQILVYESISHPLYKNCLQPQEEEGEADSGNCNILLYFGLGLMCVGSVIAFVGGWWWWGRVNIYLDEEQLLQIPICSSRCHISYSQLLCITSAILFEEWGTSKGYYY